MRVLRVAAGIALAAASAAALKRRRRSGRVDIVYADGARVSLEDDRPEAQEILRQARRLVAAVRSVGE